MIGAATAIAFVRSNWKGIAGALALVAAVGGVYALGSAHGSGKATAKYEAVIAKRDAADAKALADAMVIIKAQADYAHAQDTALLAKLGDIRSTYSNITNKVERYEETHPELSSCILDADGLRLWNSANQAARSAVADGDQ